MLIGTIAFFRRIPEVCCRGATRNNPTSPLFPEYKRTLDGLALHKVLHILVELKKAGRTDIFLYYAETVARHMDLSLPISARISGTFHSRICRWRFEDCYCKDLDMFEFKLNVIRLVNKPLKTLLRILFVEKIVDKIEFGDYWVARPHRHRIQRAVAYDELYDRAGVFRYL